MSAGGDVPACVEGVVAPSDGQLTCQNGDRGEDETRGALAGGHDHHGRQSGDHHHGCGVARTGQTDRPARPTHGRAVGRRMLGSAHPADRRRPGPARPEHAPVAERPDGRSLVPSPRHGEHVESKPAQSVIGREPMTRIAAVHGALAPHRRAQSEITDMVARTCLPEGTDRRVLDRLHRGARVDSRHMTLPSTSTGNWTGSAPPTTSSSLPPPTWAAGLSGTHCAWPGCRRRTWTC